MVQALHATLAPQTSAETLASAAPARAPRPSQIQQQTASTPAAHSTADRLTLSVTARAVSLLHQGQSIAQIAEQLGTTAAAVNGYLGIAQDTGAAPVTVVPTLKTSPSLAAPGLKAS